MIFSSVTFILSIQTVLMLRLSRAGDCLGSFQHSAVLCGLLNHGLVVILRLLPDAEAGQLPGPITDELCGHVTRYPPITAHLAIASLNLGWDTAYTIGLMQQAVLAANVQIMSMSNCP